MYADEITGSMKRAIKEMERRRNKQIEYNKKHNITPASIVKSPEEILRATSVADRITTSSKEEINIDELAKLHKEMAEAVSLMEFERAAMIRDKIKSVQRKLERTEGRKYQSKKHSGKANKAISQNS
jgi:excinuclease ABC subunit B